jgi:glycosyltransferase involved in cell wall biosynthesis
MHKFQKNELMKVLFIGNLGNTGYRFVKWLRERGEQAVLALPENIKHERSLPEWEDPFLKRNYPEWIITYKEKKVPFLFPNKTLRRLSQNFDLILTTGKYIVPVMRLNKPIVFLPVGGDLTRIPFENDTLMQIVHASLYRKRIKRVTRIITDQEDCFWAARLLGQGDKIIRFPFLLDVETIKQNVNRGFLNELKERYRSYDWIFFNPTRKNMDPGMMDYKGSEKLLEAFHEFISNNPEANVRMISGLHGKDAHLFKNQVGQLGMEKHIDFIEHLNLPELHSYMALDNVVVFDQFTNNLNALGGIQREALSFGKLVVSSTDVATNEFVKAYGESCPLLSAFTKEQILARMLEIYSMSQEVYKDRSKDIQKWTESYLHWENRIDEFIDILYHINKIV